MSTPRWRERDVLAGMRAAVFACDIAAATAVIVEDRATGGLP